VIDRLYTLRDNLKAVIDEDLSEEQLKPIWVHVCAEWEEMYPETSTQIAQLTRIAAQHTLRLAFMTLLQVVERHIASETKAEDYRAEKKNLEDAVADMKQWLKS